MRSNIWNNYCFFKYYRDNKKFASNQISFKSKYWFLLEFLDDIVKFSDLKQQDKNTRK